MLILWFVKSLRTINNIQHQRLQVVTACSNKSTTISPIITFITDKNGYRKTLGRLMKPTMSIKNKQFKQKRRILLH